MKYQDQKKSHSFTANHEKKQVRSHASGFSKSPGTNTKRQRENNAVRQPSPARMAALRVLLQYENNKTYVSLALDKELSVSAMSVADRRLCSALVYCVIENLPYLDYILSFYLETPSALDPSVRMILRMALAQAERMDKIPDNALVDEAVRCTRAAGLERMTGLVNAVLRGFLRKEKEITWPEDNIQKLSIQLCFPEWILRRLITAYGMDAAEELCQYHLEHDFMTIRPNTLKVGSDAFESVLQKKIWRKEYTGILDAWNVYGVSQLARDRDYLNGLFSVESIGSMLAAEAVSAKPGMQVLDACAAPGGKTAYLSEKMKNTGRIYAWDIHDHRVALLRAAISRLGLENVRPIVRDASKYDENMRETMDAVLLDVPCSGLGVADDKPDVKYRLTEESFLSLLQVQKNILDACCQYVKKGGCLVYSTCSMMREENEDQIRDFLSTHPDFSVVAPPATYPEHLAEHYGEFGLQLLPQRDKTVGFYIVKMRRAR